MTGESTAARGNFVQALRASAWLIVLCVVVLAAAAYAYSATQTKTYSAVSSVTVQDPATAVTGTPSTAQTPAALAAAEAARITRPEVSRAVAARIGAGHTPTGLASAVTTYVDATSNAVQITASARTASLAARIANAFATEDARQTNGAIARQYAVQARALERRIAALGRSAAADEVRATLAPQLVHDQSLAISAPEVQLAQLATPPSSPSSPKTARNVVILAVIGLIVGIVLADVRRARDRRVRVPEDVQALIDHPVVGHISSAALGRAKSHDDPRRIASPADLEAVRILRQNLQFLTRDTPSGCVLVTSAVAQEGKSTVAVLLAQASADAGRRTLLVECDLRRPVLAQRLTTDGEVGLADYLRGDAGLAEIVNLVPATTERTVPVAAPVGSTGSGGGATVAAPLADAGFACITAGTGPRPAQLLESERLGELIAEARSDYDLVVVDTTPLLSVADALEVAPFVDSVALCVRLRRTTRDELLAASEALARVPDKPVGLVLNGVTKSIGYPGYDE